MTPHPLLRSPTAWACTTLLAVLLVGWAVSLPRIMTASSRAGYGGGVGRGRLIVNWAIWADRPLGRAALDYHVVPLQNVWTFDGMRRGPGWTVAIPFWCPATIAAGASIAAWRHTIRARRRAALGACLACGYSRTGLTPATPCPECGAAASHPSPTAR